MNTEEHDDDDAAADVATCTTKMYVSHISDS